MLEFGYVAIFLSLAVLIYFAIRRVTLKHNSDKINEVTLKCFLGLGAWIFYLFMISRNGFIFEKSFPPRFPIFVFLPVLILFVIFFFNRGAHKRKNAYFESIPPSWPVFFQSFRIVMELVIFKTFLAGIMPIQATFQGYNFEIVFALTAPVVGYFAFVKPIISKRLVVVWNIIGILFLLIVVNIMITSFYLPQIWGSEDSLVGIRFTQLPFLLLPAFMVPAAIFAHVFSIMQILKEDQ